MTDPMLDVLRGARSLIAQGWQKGGWYSTDRSRVCAMTAIILSGGGRVVDDGWLMLPDANSLGREAERFLVGLIPDRLRYHCDCGIVGCHVETRITRLPEFNDAPGTTQADVLMLFDKGIAVLEMREQAQREWGAAERQKAREEVAKKVTSCKTSMAFNIVVGGEKPVVNWTDICQPVSKWSLASTGAVVAAKIAGNRVKAGT